MLNRICAVGFLSISALTNPPAYAASNFIETYIDANGGCGRSANALAFVLAGQGRQSPFGRSAGDWTDDDLVALKTAMAECDQAAAEAGNPYRLAEVKNDTAELLVKIPAIVRAARSERDAQKRQLEARRAITQSRIESANRAKADAKALAATEVTRLENEAARAEADARQAIATANRQIDQASRTAGDEKAAIADDLARLRPKSPLTKQSDDTRPDTPFRQEATRGNRDEPPEQLRELPTEVRPASTNTSFVGCKGADQLVTTSKGILSKNMAPVERLVTAGQCFVIDDGTRVRVAVEDVKSGSKAACVGVDGHPACLWLPSNILTFDQ